MKPPPNSLYNKFMAPFRGLPCDLCPTIKQYDGNPHHIVYRSQSGHMTLVALNIIPLCVDCHADAHKNKFCFFEWLDRNYPGRLERLNEIKKELQRERATHKEIYEKYGAE